MAFKDLVKRVFGKSKADEEYDKAMKQYEGRQPKKSVPVVKPKEKTIDEDIEEIQQRRRNIAKKVEPFKG